MYLFRKTVAQEGAVCHSILSMKRILLFSIAVVLFPLCLSAQDVPTDTTLSEVYEIAAEMAENMEAVPEEEAEIEKPKYWNKGISTQIGFSQVGITQWADGANQSLSFNSFIDAFANYAKDKIIWETRLQLAYGVITDIDDGFTKKTDDNIQLDSKFGYNISKDLYLSAQYSFKTQFSNGYDCEQGVCFFLSCLHQSGSRYRLQAFKVVERQFCTCYRRSGDSERFRFEGKIRKLQKG